MELLETHDPEKRKLIETSDQHKRELEREVDKIALRGEQVIKNALIIGGALAVTYLVVSRLTRSSSKTIKTKKAAQPETGAAPAVANLPEEPSLLSVVGEKVANAATLILLEVAREKLTEVFKNRSAQS